MEQELTQNEQLQAAMKTLENFIINLSLAAGKSKEYGEELWHRISRSQGVLKEVAYYHDYGGFWGQYKVAGYTLPDILVWQVDHFKAYMDRHEDMNRYRTERLFLESIDVMLKMETEPEKYIQKMTDETGTDFAEKY
jgi:type II secretory pathway component PulJ